MPPTTNPSRFDATQPRQAFRLAVIVCSAMVVAVFVYATVVSILRTTLRPTAAPVGDVERFAIFTFAFVSVLSLRWIRGTLLRGDSRETAETRLARRLRASIVTAAACEAPAVMGFVLFLIGAPISDFYLLAALSVSAGLVYFPRWSQWKEDLGSAAR